MSPDRIDYEKLLVALVGMDHHVRRLEIHGCLESTNAHILRLSAAAAHGRAVISHEQSAGHGRHGRSWHSPPGGIYLSLGWRLSRPTVRPVLLTWATAAIVMNMLHKQGLNNTKVEWPNDIYCSGGKLGGVLVEIKTTEATSSLAVIGIGINTQPLDGGRIGAQPVTDLKSLGLAVPRHQLISSLLSMLSSALHGWQQQSTKAIVKKYQTPDCFWQEQSTENCSAPSG